MEAIELGLPAAGPLADAVAMAQRLVQGQRASLMLPVSDNDGLRVVAAHGLASGAFQSDVHDYSISSIVARNRQPLLVNQMRVRTRTRATSYMTGSFISVPLPIGNEQMGVLNVADPQAGHFRVDDLSILLSLAEQIGPAVASTWQQVQIGRLEATNLTLRRQVIAAIEDERKRLAHELHDEAGHTITAALLRLDLALAHLPAEATQSRTLVEAVHTSLVDYTATLHAMAFALRPRILQDLGLGATLRSLADQALECGLAEVTIRIEGEATDLSEEVELLIFRVVQEALTNIRKHARASRAEVVLRIVSGHLEQLTIEDDGVGLDLSVPDVQAGRPSLGLSGIRERVKVLGGHLKLGPGSRGGTRLAVSLPR